MSERLIVATGNKNKMTEIRQILGDVDVEILSMREAGIDVEIIEDGDTFAKNAEIKAATVARAAGRMAIADDSGLVIDCLRGEPGIYSARYLGREASYDLKNKVLIDRVDDYCRGFSSAGSALVRTDGSEFIPENSGEYRPGADEDGNPGPLRAARFVCACAVAWPDGRTKTIVGTMEGRIAYHQAGQNGFGYDPIFFLPGFLKTSAELTPEEKNAVSHRGKAFSAMHDYLVKELGQ